jgi:hypothetical protein
MILVPASGAVAQPAPAALHFASGGPTLAGLLTPGGRLVSRLGFGPVTVG